MFIVTDLVSLSETLHTFQRIVFVSRVPSGETATFT